MKKSFLISFFLLLLTLASCRKDELYAPQQHGVGMIELMLDGDDGSETITIDAVTGNKQ